LADFDGLLKRGGPKSCGAWVGDQWLEKPNNATAQAAGLRAIQVEAGVPIALSAYVMASRKLC